MADNSRKTPLVGSLTRSARRQIYNAIALDGKALPASVVSINGSIVEVKFEVTTHKTLPNVTIPIETWQYIIPSIQVGELGIVRPSDTLIGNISGLGASGAPLLDQPPGNLGSLVFCPVSNTGWAAAPANRTLVWGPNGVQLRNGSGTSTIDITNSGITFAFGGHSIVINSTGVIIDGKTFLTHEHSGVTIGTDPTGPVV
jgi:hypothetical protein